MHRLSDSQREAVLAELPALRRFCLSLVGNPADGDDLLQATIERLLTKGMPTDAHPAKWAFRVCKNLWIDDYRAREVRSRMSHMVATDPLDEISIEQDVDGRLKLDVVIEALDQLPAEQRLALVLVAIDGKSYAEAADILEVAHGTIMSRVARARKALSTILSSEAENRWTAI